ncbi:MAG: phosphatase PAP2 family protein, partial [Sphingomicrobium sp.]
MTRWDNLYGRSYLLQIGVLTALAIVAAYAAAFFFGGKQPHLIQEYFLLALQALIVIGGSSLACYTILLAVAGEPQPLRKVVKVIRPYVTIEYLRQHLLPLLFTFLFLGAFSELKALIPMFHFFAWDQTFSDYDRLLFAGSDPWRITHALIGASGTWFIDIVYSFWLPIFTGVVLYFSAFANEEQQRRFFLCLYRMWIILGLIAAIVFSSAGPCFLELIHNPYASRYGGLFPLHDAQFTRDTMDYVAMSYSKHTRVLGVGISAMPSMHVAMALLFALVPVTRIMKIVGLCYYILIFIGSVHLGWHYAVDGVVSTIAA